MNGARSWAFLRRLEYGTYYSVFLLCILSIGYYAWFYESASCFDGSKNGSEMGRDCGGACKKVCAFDVEEPVILWTNAFRVADGVYNVVSYVENRNVGIGAQNVGYTITLFDNAGDVITEERGSTGLPPDSVYPIFAGRLITGSAIPKRAELVLDSIDSWQKMQYGREQFTVLNRTLRGADSQPRLEATISNNELEEATDVEVVATIFDARGKPLTASRTTIPLFEARTEKKVTFTWPEPIAKTLRTCEVPSDVVLAIDLSGSINDDGGTPPEPISSVLNAAAEFARRLEGGDMVSVVTFATGAILESPLTDDVMGTAALISKLAVAPESEHGSTNIGDALVEAEVELSSPRHNLDARKILVLLTDGKANAPETETAEAYALEIATELKQRGTDIFTIGLGKNLNVEFLKTLATSEKHRFLAVDRSTLEDIYQTISRAICEEGAAVIEIIPKPDSSVR